MTRVYVGNLDVRASEHDVEKEFGYYGRLREVWVARTPPGFAFVEFEDTRDATDAVRQMDGRRICNQRVRVEHARGPPRGRGGSSYRSSTGRSGRFDGPPPRDERCYNCGRNGHYARDCRSRDGDRDRDNRSRSRHDTDRRRPARSVSRSPIRGRRRSYSESPRRRSASRSPRARSRSPRGRAGSRSPRRRSPSRSPSPRQQRSMSPRRSASPYQDRRRSASPYQGRSRSPSAGRNSRGSRSPSADRYIQEPRDRHSGRESD